MMHDEDLKMNILINELKSSYLKRRFRMNISIYGLTINITISLFNNEIVCNFNLYDYYIAFHIFKLIETKYTVNIRSFIHFYYPFKKITKIK